MSKIIILLTSYALAWRTAHSFQLQAHPHHIKTKPRPLTKLDVGSFIDPRDWFDVQPHDDDANPPPGSPPPSSALSPIESIWTKYGMIAYVAHMCAFLPLSLLPTLLQTKMGLIGKSESEHQALQVGQKCAQTLLRWIPFMNVGE